MEIVDKIIDQISHHRAEILKLESALAVIEELGGKPKAKQMPLITVRRTEGPTVAKKGGKSLSTAVVRARVKELLSTGPATTSELQREIDPSGNTAKRLWNIMYTFRKEGVVTVDESKRYSLVVPPVVDGSAGTEQAA